MLEKRLATIAEMVDKNVRLADIGTDHAYLPIYLVENDKIQYAIASDVAKGPLENAKNDIYRAHLQNKIDTRLGSGLQTITSDDKINTVVIAGMGGKLMVLLLEEAKKQGKIFPTLILEPNVGENIVRTWLNKNNYQIIKEEIIDTAGHIYEIIKARREDQTDELNEKQIYFGPILLNNKNDVFKKKWKHQLEFQKNLLVNLNKAKVPNREKIANVKELIQMIQEVLND